MTTEKKELINCQINWLRELNTSYYVIVSRLDKLNSSCSEKEKMREELMHAYNKNCKEIDKLINTLIDEN